MPFALSLEDAIARVRARNPVLNAFISTRLEDAIADGEVLRREAPRSPIHGVPYSLKDLWDTTVLPTTGGSYRFRDRRPTADAPIAEVLRDAGGVLLGKTNLSDFGLSVESQSYVGGITKNPLDPARTAGGSSGGAAAAVADGMSAFDWGSDFGGSIRIPAACCGIYGLRLSTEAWPPVGHFPEPPPSVWYMNGQGPLTKTLEDMRALLAVTRPRLRTGSVRRFELKGALLYAPEGAYAGEWPSFVADVEPALARILSGVSRDHGLMPVHKAFDVARSMYASHLEDLLDADESLTFFGALGSVLGSLALRGRIGHKTFHPRTAEMLLLIALGRGTLYRSPAKAEAEARVYRDAVAEAWDRGYVVVAPTMAHPAPKHGGTLGLWRFPSLAMPGNVADVTGLAMPFGRFPNGMPRSIQLWGPPGSEDALIDLAERLA